ncbi:unnamed protein product [Amoebophrya sp. A120]|nr:unnamed protein product [Amoebophrya sp. A120]|eukprot:GSA120T00008454001.1
MLKNLVRLWRASDHAGLTSDTGDRRLRQPPYEPGVVPASTTTFRDRSGEKATSSSSADDVEAGLVESQPVFPPRRPPYSTVPEHALLDQSTGTPSSTAESEPSLPSLAWGARDDELQGSILNYSSGSGKQDEPLIVRGQLSTQEELDVPPLPKILVGDQGRGGKQRSTQELQRNLADEPSKPPVIPPGSGSSRTARSLEREELLLEEERIRNNGPAYHVGDDVREELDEQEKNQDYYLQEPQPDPIINIDHYSKLFQDEKQVVRELRNELWLHDKDEPFMKYKSQGFQEKVHDPGGDRTITDHGGVQLEQGAAGLSSPTSRLKLISEEDEMDHDRDRQSSSTTSVNKHQVRQRTGIQVHLLEDEERQMRNQTDGDVGGADNYTPGGIVNRGSYNGRTATSVRVAGGLSSSSSPKTTAGPNYRRGKAFVQNLNLKASGGQKLWASVKEIVSNQFHFSPPVIFQRNMDYWRYESNPVYVLMPDESYMPLWRVGAGIPGFWKDDMLMWDSSSTLEAAANNINRHFFSSSWAMENLNSVSSTDTYSKSFFKCRIAFCEYWRHRGFHECVVLPIEGQESYCPFSVSTEEEDINNAVDDRNYDEKTSGSAATRSTAAATGSSPASTRPRPASRTKDEVNTLSTDIDTIRAKAVASARKVWIKDMCPNIAPAQSRPKPKSTKAMSSAVVGGSRTSSQELPGTEANAASSAAASRTPSKTRQLHHEHPHTTGTTQFRNYDPRPDIRGKLFCEQDTGETCYDDGFFGAKAMHLPSRCLWFHAKCRNNRCVCPSNKCFVHGRCVDVNVKGNQERGGGRSKTTRSGNYGGRSVVSTNRGGTNAQNLAAVVAPHTTRSSSPSAFTLDRKNPGTEVCLNSSTAPSCKVGSWKGFVYRNRLHLTVLRPVVDIFSPPGGKNTRSLASSTAHKEKKKHSRDETKIRNKHGEQHRFMKRLPDSAFDVIECEYNLFQCDINKWKGFLHDTGIICDYTFSRARRLAEGVDPEKAIDTTGHDTLNVIAEDSDSKTPVAAEPPFDIRRACPDIKMKDKSLLQNAQVVVEDIKEEIQDFAEEVEGAWENVVEQTRTHIVQPIHSMPGNTLRLLGNPQNKLNHLYRYNAGSGKLEETDESLIGTSQGSSTSSAVLSGGGLSSERRSGTVQPTASNSLINKSSSRNSMLSSPSLADVVLEVSARSKATKITFDEGRGDGGSELNADAPNRKQQTTSQGLRGALENTNEDQASSSSTTASVTPYPIEIQLIHDYRARSNFKDSNEPEAPKPKYNKVFLSFGLDWGYGQAQGIKSWGAGGPARTVYDTCSKQKCDWHCLKDNSCSFKCCENDLFRQVEFLRVEGTNEYETYEIVCRGAGYIDPMVEFDGALSQYKQKWQNEVLTILKLCTIPGVSALAAKVGLIITPWVWFAVGIVWSFSDWVLAHRQQDKFHEWISDFRIKDWHGTGLIEDGILIHSTKELLEYPSHCLCKFMFGFVYVFLPSFITNVAALLGTELLQGVLGKGATDSARQAWESTDLAVKFQENVYSFQSFIWKYLGQWLHLVGSYLLTGDPNSQYAPGWVQFIIDNLREPNAAFGGLMWQLTNAIGYYPNMKLIAVLQNAVMKLLLSTGMCQKPSKLSESISAKLARSITSMNEQNSLRNNLGNSSAPVWDNHFNFDTGTSANINSQPGTINRSFGGSLPNSMRNQDSLARHDRLHVYSGGNSHEQHQQLHTGTATTSTATSDSSRPANGKVKDQHDHNYDDYSSVHYNTYKRDNDRDLGMDAQAVMREIQLTVDQKLKPLVQDDTFAQKAQELAMEEIQQTGGKGLYYQANPAVRERRAEILKLLGKGEEVAVSDILGGGKRTSTSDAFFFPPRPSSNSDGRGGRRNPQGQQHGVRSSPPAGSSEELISI